MASNNRPNGSNFGTITPAAHRPPPPPKCRVELQPDGGLQVHFLIEPDMAKRLVTRSNGMPMDKYLWENILYRAVCDHVY